MSKLPDILMRGLLGGLLFFGLFACVDYAPEEERRVNVRLSDPEIREIFDQQDRQQVDSLFPYFEHPNATYRYLAAMAFASIRDPEGIAPLARLLEDPVDSVRLAAAYALGQIGDSTAAPLLAAAFDTSAGHWQSKKAILEAVGKCAPAAYLDYLATARNYEPGRQEAVKGLARGIYQFGLRGINSAAADRKMAELAADPAYPVDSRHLAAQHLARSARGLDSLEAYPDLIRTFEEEEDPRLRMTLALALGKTRRPEVIQAFLEAWPRESDYRVRCNIQRALIYFEYPAVRDLASLGLKDPHPAVAQRAAEFFVDKGATYDSYQYWRWSRDSVPGPVAVLLHKATMRHLPLQADTNRRTYSYIIRSRFARETAPYAKADWFRAMIEDPWTYRYIYRMGFDHPSLVVRTASVGALRQISSHPEFNRFFGQGSFAVRKEFSVIFMQALASQDAGMISEAAIALRQPERNYAQFLSDSIPRLMEILNRLTLPEQLEPYLELQRTIYSLQGLSAEAGREDLQYNHPIDWNRMLISVPERAVISTDRGDIEIELYPESCPGTVLNFVNLAEQGFYDDKVFHRVVPNFVIQGGCPRGDGYGSLDYSIRSELAYLHYEQEGMVGMASAGNHTEGTQFFITHAPTPHLNGNYTLFGRVTSGMEVVHAIRIGDRIRSVSIE